ncbi:MAG: hypothetical protein L0H59_13550 [Tomitella sp.]|nr:hypothetical protein [Tomitella sp.]
MDVNAMETAAASVEPVEGLRTVVALRRLASRLEDLHVGRARAASMSWAEIAAHLEVTRQTVHKKHGRTRGPRRLDTDADL